MYEILIQTKYFDTKWRHITKHVYYKVTKTCNGRYINTKRNSNSKLARSTYIRYILILVSYGHCVNILNSRFVNEIKLNLFDFLKGFCYVSFHK